MLVTFYILKKGKWVEHEVLVHNRCFVKFGYNYIW